MADALLRGVRPVSFTGTARPDGENCDIRIRAGRITEIGPRLTSHGEEIHDGNGRYAIPGLWDAHVHLGQWGLMVTRLDTSRVASVDEARALVRDRLRDLPPGATLQGWGHRSASWTPAPSTGALDAVSTDHPIVLISGDGHHGWLNSTALELLDVPWRDEVITESEWFASYPRIMDLPGVRGDLESRYPEVVADANARGIVGIVDMEWAAGHRDWPSRFTGVTAGRRVDTLRVRTATYETGLDDVIAAGLRTGDSLSEGEGLLEMGPLKIISDGSINTRTAYCCEPFADSDDLADPCGVQNISPGDLTELLRTATACGLEVAVHAIGDRAAKEAIDAIEAAGANGSIEHAQLMRWPDVARMARLGIRASVQPAHLWDDRDVTHRYWPDREERCFPLRALHDAGVTLALGSDAPVSRLDPWLEVAAAVHRSADDREPWHPEQALTLSEALAASTDGHRALRPGGPGDIVLLDRDPLAVPETSREAAQALLELSVTATFVAGRLVHSK